MVEGAEASGGWSTRPNDPRVTKVGRLLRLTSIDELPQLFNVIRGDMSLVGPRPLVPAQEFDHEPEQWRERCEVRPGITGLAQVALRSEAGERRIELDLEYVRAMSVGLDFKIMLGTIRRLGGSGGN
jgi:lipopolysaccharide/colanic/teichoic acid biosynthesis glycosyltransferase